MERLFGISARRILLFLSLSSWMFGRTCVIARTASAETTTRATANVTLPRTLWSRTMKELVALKGEIRLLRASVEEKDSLLGAERNACATRLATERVRHAEQIKSLRACPPPTACYIGLGVCGALVVGAGVGGYYIGKGGATK